MESEAPQTSTSSMGMWALVAAGIAIVIAIVAIVLVFVIPGPAGKNGADGKQGLPGQQGPSGIAIMSSQPAAVYSTSGYNYTIPAIYNYVNVVIPTVPTVGADIYFTINANAMNAGDVFTIDNTNNPKSTLYVQYSGFDNNLAATNEVSVNDNNTGARNTIYVQVTAGRSASTKNIILMANFS